MAVLTRDTVIHVNATGDTNANTALSEVIDSLLNKHVVLVNEQYTKSRSVR
jgi:hypothetical protein